MIGLLSLLVLSPLQQAPADPAAGQGIVISEGDTRVMQVPPHSGTGMSTAYDISDQAPNRAMEFRKRVMHPGASIGVHPINHDEVYYVLSGTGVVHIDGVEHPMAAGDAAYLYDGNHVGIRQTGDEDLELIIAYPLSARVGSH